MKILGWDFLILPSIKLGLRQIHKFGGKVGKLGALVIHM